MFLSQILGKKLALDGYGAHIPIHNNIPAAGSDHILFPINIWWKLLKFEDIKLIARNKLWSV